MGVSAKDDNHKGTKGTEKSKGDKRIEIVTDEGHVGHATVSRDVSGETMTALKAMIDAAHKKLEDKSEG